MAIIFFVLTESRNEVCKPVAWIYFEITFTLTRFCKNVKNQTKSLKVALDMKKKTKSNFQAVFYHLFELNFGHCQLLPPRRGEKEH